MTVENPTCTLVSLQRMSGFADLSKLEEHTVNRIRGVRTISESISSRRIFYSPDERARFSETVASAPLPICGFLNLSGPFGLHVAFIVTWMTTASSNSAVFAINQTMRSLGIKPRDLRSEEIMDAFAIQTVACVRSAGLDPTTVSSWGGGVLRGRPIGA